jgi:hypothetical protein
MSFLAPSLLITLLMTGVGMISCDAPKDPPKPPLPKVAANAAPALPVL